MSTGRSARGLRPARPSRQAGVRRLAVSLDHGEALRGQAASAKADQPGGENQRGKGGVEKEDRDERRCRQRDHGSILQYPLADSEHGFQHDGHHRRLKPKEQGLHGFCTVKTRVDDAQDEDGHKAGQHKQRAGHQAARRAVHHPADVGRQLLGFRTGEKHAVVQRVQEPLLADPLLLVDKNAVHDGDLPRGPAEAQAGHAAPRPERLPPRDVRRRRCGRGRLGPTFKSIWHASQSYRRSARKDESNRRQIRCNRRHRRASGAR